VSGCVVGRCVLLLSMFGNLSNKQVGVLPEIRRTKEDEWKQPGRAASYS